MRLPSLSAVVVGRATHQTEVYSSREKQLIWYSPVPSAFIVGLSPLASHRGLSPDRDWHLSPTLCLRFEGAALLRRGVVHRISVIEFFSRSTRFLDESMWYGLQSGEKALGTGPGTVLCLPPYS